MNALDLPNLEDDTAYVTWATNIGRALATQQLSDKRAGLLLQEPERLARLLSNSARPVVLVFAGKAHPHDEAGKLLIRQIIEASRAAQFRGRIIFLANYDVELA